MDIKIEECLYTNNFFPLWEMIFVVVPWFAIEDKKKNNIRCIFLDFGVHFCIDKSLLYKNLEVHSAIFQKDI